MKTFPQLIWSAHGEPAVAGCVNASGRCYVCVGEVTRGKLVADWLSTNFTDSNRARSPASTHVCEACAHVSSRVAPVLGRPVGPCSVCKGTLKVVVVPKAGKGSKSRKGDDCPKCDGSGMNKSGGSFRNVSHLYSEGWAGVVFGESAPVACYANASKGEKPLIREFLQRRHTGVWGIGVADSGQKHVAVFTPLNYGPGGTVLFEEELVDLPDSFELIDACTDMLTGGVTKDELLSGDYRVMTMREMAAEVRAFEIEHGARHRGSGWMSLAVWLAQRDTEQHEAIASERKQRDKERKNAGRSKTKKTGNTDRGVRARAQKRVPARAERAPADELLGAVQQPDAVSGAADDARKRVGDASPAQAANPKHSQVRLPGLD